MGIFRAQPRVLAPRHQHCPAYAICGCADVYPRALRTSIPPTITKPIVLRASAGQSILTELSNELVAVGIKVPFIPMPPRWQGLYWCRIRTQIHRQRYQVNRHGYQIWYPHPRRYWRWNGHEQGSTLLWSRHAHMCRDRRAYVSYYFEPGFEKVVAGCPVPIVIAGGKKLPR